MNNRHLTIIITLVSAFCFFSCKSIDPKDQKIMDAVNLHMSIYPETTLQDLYKSFFQAEFGAEHIVADTTGSGKYLSSELQTPDVKNDILYEPIGADSSFFRVHLKAVQKGYITRNMLFDAFLKGVYTVEIPQIESWAQTWPHICSVIESMNLGLENMDSDKENINNILQSGEYASHHSEKFSEEYDPHYRIIRKDVFYNELFPYLEDK